MQELHTRQMGLETWLQGQGGRSRCPSRTVQGAGQVAGCLALDSLWDLEWVESSELEK